MPNIAGNRVSGRGQGGADDERQSILYHNYMSSVAYSCTPAVSDYHAELVGDASAASAFVGGGQFGSGFLCSVATAYHTANITGDTYAGAIDLWITPQYNPASMANEDICAWGTASDTPHIGIYHDGTADTFVAYYTDAGGSTGITCAASDCGFTASGDNCHLGFAWSQMGTLDYHATLMLYTTNATTGATIPLAWRWPTLTRGVVRTFRVGNSNGINAVSGFSNAIIENVKIWKHWKKNVNGLSHDIVPQ